MFSHQAVIGNRAYIVRQTFANDDTDFSIVWQSINPKTGKAWQATHTVMRLEDTTKAKAMRAWLYECNKVRKAQAA